jgi:hypothetical protein
VQTHLDDLADEYLRLHQKKERLFWTTKMGTSQDHEAYEQAEVATRRFLGDAGRLAALRDLSRQPMTEDQRKVLEGWIEFFARNTLEGEEAQQHEKAMIEAEGALERHRTAMELGYVQPASGEFVRASSLVLGNMLRSDPDEARRKAAWEGLRSIETFVLDHGFCDIVRRRNALARALGHVDYYEYKVRKDEGFSKARLFELLDDLVARTTDAARAELNTLKDRDGIDGTLPWNYTYLTSGSLAAEKEPYFQFEDSLERWGRSFAAMGIRYRSASLTLDLVDRPGKYENGFMHGPTPAFRRRGQWLPAEINFTANAVPGQVGAGHVAMVTLFHEGGHAAHFANVVTDAPCFSQEFAPTSTAFAETQSMFMDSLLSDADWQSRYACDAQGRPIPFELIERDLRQRQPSLASGLRRMLTICYFEKAMYELGDDEITPDRLLRLAREVERDLLFFELGSPRPILSVPHLLSNDSSAYYHGYVLATMALEQTKDHFLRTYGHIVDNPRIGPDLAQKYWEPGNAIGFFDYVERLTGEPLSADALVWHVSRTPDQAVEAAHEAVARLAETPRFDGPVELDCRLAVVHGTQQVVQPDQDFASGIATFRQWVRQLGSAS